MFGSESGEENHAYGSFETSVYRQDCEIDKQIILPSLDIGWKEGCYALVSMILPWEEEGRRERSGSTVLLQIINCIRLIG
jgi:hypothetical protein